MKKSEQKCEFCKKDGLPVFPARYAIAPDEAMAPKLSGNLSVTDAGGKAIGGKAGYTVRMLRSGYLYTFDEARKRWEAYFVTEGGFFYRFAVKEGAPANVKELAPCAREGHNEVASCITITSPSLATKVWFGFSDAEWTEDVFKRHADAAYRRRHMRCFDVKAWLASASQKHAVRIKRIATTVAEYSNATKAESFSFSASAYHSRRAQAKGLVAAAAAMSRRPGAVVLVPDPAGIAMDFALLMKRRTEDFKESDPDRKYKAEVSSVICQLEEGIRVRAFHQKVEKAEDIANMQGSQIELAELFSKKYREAKAALIEDLRDVSFEEREHAEKQEWERYTKKFDAKARAEWQKQYEQEFATFDAEQIAPLALAHAAWMKSRRMSAYFECNYDENDIHSGAVYHAVFNACTLSTDDKAACQALYSEWLSHKECRADNLLLNALTFNQEELKKLVDNAANSASWEQLPWDKLFESFDKAIQTAFSGQPDTVGRIVGGMAGSIARTIAAAAKSESVFAGLVALGAYAKQPFVMVTVTGGKKVFRAAITRQLIRLSGGNLNKYQVEKAVAVELKRLRAMGVPLEGTDKKRWLLMIDTDGIKDMPRGASKQQIAQALAKRIHTLEEAEAMAFSKWEAGMGKQLDKAGNWVGKLRPGVPVAFGILGILANSAAYASVLNDDAKALEHTKPEMKGRIYAQLAQVIGACAGTIEATVANLAMPVLGGGRGLIAVKALGSWIGKFLGVGGAIIMGLIDIGRGILEFSEGNNSAGFAYVVSGVLAIAATVFIAIGWTGWGLVLVALMIVWAFVMTMLVDDKIQDWLERCVWGNLVAKRYNNHQLEMQEYQKVIAD